MPQHEPLWDVAVSVAEAVVSRVAISKAVAHKVGTGNTTDDDTDVFHINELVTTNAISPICTAKP